MRILLVNNRYFLTGGPERYMFGIKGELEKLGHEVIPFSLEHRRNEKSGYSAFFAKDVGSGDDIFFDEYRKDLKTWIRVVSRQIYSFHVERSLSNLIKKTRPDVCYLLQYYNKLSPSVIASCKRHGVPVVHRLSDYYIMCPQAGFYRGGRFCDDCRRSRFSVVKNRCIRGSLSASLLKYFSMALQRRLGLFEKIDVYICTNDFMRKKMLEFGFDRKKLHTIKTYFNESLWGGEEKRLAHLKRPGDEIRLVCAGNFDESKGTYDLLDAVRQIVAQRPGLKFRLILAGGLHKKEVERVGRLIRENRLEKHIKAYPAISTDRLKGIYLDSDLSILPSRWVENMPNVLLESLYFSLPVVVPRHGCFPGLVGDEVSFMYEPYSVRSLKNVLETAISNPGRIYEKSLRCRGYLEKNFSRERHVQELLRCMGGLAPCSA